MATLPDLMPALPEILLALGALALLLVGLFSGANAERVVSALAIVLLLVVAAVVVASPVNGITFSGAFVADAFGRYLKVLTLLASAAAILVSGHYSRQEKFDRFEYPVVVVISTIGMLLLISANDLISVYLGVELMSLSLYVLAAIDRDSVRSTEAGIKYFVLGALSSGMMLYGMSLVYGFTGHTEFGQIAQAVANGHSGTGFAFGIAFVLAGFCFKVSAVPFHMWTPDVYEGSPTSVTVLFASAPKIAAMAVFVRVVIEAFGTVDASWQQIVVFVSIASMLLGSFAAIGQTNIKRLMAYSSIGHMGFALVGLAAGTAEGVTGVIVYMSIYLPMTLGAFAVILSMRRNGTALENISDLAGLARSRPVISFVLAMIMFSLAGIPPLAGFFAKFYVFAAAIHAGFYWLSVIGVLSSVVGAFYYLRVVKIMYFDEPAEAFEPMTGSLKFVLGISGLAVMLFVAFAGPVVDAANAAAASLF